jgi:hypothetical protein
MEVHEAGREEKWRYIKGMRPIHVGPEFTSLILLRKGTLIASVIV